MCSRPTCPLLAFINRKGLQSSSSDMNELFHEALLDLFEEHRDLFPPNISTRMISQTGTRGAVVSSDNFFGYRWKKEEQASHSCPSQPINQHYLSTNTTLTSRFVFTSPSSGTHRPCNDQRNHLPSFFFAHLRKSVMCKVCIGREEARVDSLNSPA